MHSLKASEMHFQERSCCRAVINGFGRNELMAVKIARSETETKMFFRHPKPLCLHFSFLFLAVGEE